MSAEYTIKSSVKLNSGHEMPILGLGVYQNHDCYPACVAALEAGYRHIDTAQMYRNEADVGRAVRDSGVDRSEVFVTSKVIQRSHGYETTLKVVDESLEKLQFDYIDLYLIHSPLSGKVKRLEAYRALLQKKKEGKIRAVGVSNYSGKHMEEIREAGLEMPCVNQIELHPFCQQRPIVEYDKKNGIITQAYSPLVRGRFDDPVIQEISEKYKKHPVHVLLRWSIQRGLVPLPKSSNPERVVSNADFFDFELTKEDMEKLDALDKGADGAVTWNPVGAD